jgi:broad specificity phosphatase PhoE
MKQPGCGSETLMTNRDPGIAETQPIATDTILVFVRHGQTDWNSQGRWQGWLNSPLTEAGVEQARAAAEELRGMKLDLAHCSDSGRAVETARIIAEPHGLQLHMTESLRERFFGAYEGLNSAEIAESLPGTRFAEEKHTRDNYRPPGGETMVEVRDRVERCLRSLVAKNPGKTILLVTHSGVVRAVDSLRARKSFEDLWDRVPCNGCIFILRATQDGRFLTIRDFVPPPVTSPAG